MKSHPFFDALDAVKVLVADPHDPIDKFYIRRSDRGIRTIEAHSSQGWFVFYSDEDNNHV